MIRQPFPDGFERAITFRPAWDHRKDDPNKGQHVAEFYFTLIGPLGAVTLRIFSGWDYSLPDRLFPDVFPFNADDAGVFYCSLHEPIEEYYGHETQECTYLPGGKCYFAGSSFSGGDRPFAILIREGEEPFWKHMRELYDEHWPMTVSETNQQQQP